MTFTYSNGENMLGLSAKQLYHRCSVLYYQIVASNFKEYFTGFYTGYIECNGTSFALPDLVAFTDPVKERVGQLIGIHNIAGGAGIIIDLSVSVAAGSFGFRRSALGCATTIGAATLAVADKISHMPAHLFDDRAREAVVRLQQFILEK